MANKYLQLVAGVLSQVEALVTSAGTGDSGKIPALNAFGKTDLTMTSLPPGYYHKIASANNAGTPNTKIDTTIGGIVVVDSGGDTKLMQGVSYTIDATTVGANGLDAGSLSVTTWYYEFVIVKPDGTTAGLLSTSATSPTMPSGYTFKAFVGPRLTGNPANLNGFNQYDNEIFVNRLRFLTGASATTETAQSLTSIIPSMCIDFDVLDVATLTADGSGVAQASLEYRVKSGAALMTEQVKLSSLGASLTGVVVHAGHVGTFPNIGQNIYYLWTVTTGSAQAVSSFVYSYRIRMT